MKYRMYVDEVGNSDLESSENPNHRFLSLTGVVIELGYVQTTLHPELETLKLDYFGSHPDDPIILHRKEMVNAKFPFQNLRDASFRARFDGELLALMANWDYRVFTVCLDKKSHKETYSVWRYDPYHYCLAILLERYVMFLSRIGCRGDVMAESRGGKEDRRLKDAFSRLWDRGTDFMPPDRFQSSLTSKQLKVKQKANNVAGLQLADLLAHPSRNEILSEQNLLERDVAPFAEKIIQILQQKYDQHAGRNFGKKFL